MATYDVTKTSFSQKKIDGFFWNVDGRRQIDVGEGTVSFASFSALFLSYRENPAGGNIPPPPAGRGLISWTKFYDAFWEVILDAYLEKAKAAKVSWLLWLAAAESAGCLRCWDPEACYVIGILRHVVTLLGPWDMLHQKYGLAISWNCSEIENRPIEILCNYDAIFCPNSSGLRSSYTSQGTVSMGDPHTLRNEMPRIYS